MRFFVFFVLLLFSVAACAEEKAIPQGPRPPDIPTVYTMEATALYSDIIARVELLSKTTFEASDEYGNDFDILEFHFRVIEYLKGTGEDEIYGWVVAFRPTRTAGGVTHPNLATWHDENHPFDAREAIVFFDDHAGLSGLPVPTLPAGKYILSSFGYLLDGKMHDGYTIASPHSKNWFPAAAETPSEAKSDPLYLIDVPQNTGKGAKSPTAPTMSLSSIRQLITDVEAEANAGGTDEYRSCIEHSHTYKGVLDYAAQKRGERHETWTALHPVPSGSPAGVVFHKWSHAVPTSTATTTNWLEGEDAAYFIFGLGETVHHVGMLHYSRRYLETARPLPAGGYEFFVNQYHPLSCYTDVPEFLRNRVKAKVQVVAPPRTVHEFFFDPTTIGTAVGADASNGVLKPNAFSLDGATTTISSLQWEDGAVSMTLSPTASLDSYAIDSIDITGTTTLSLSSDNASTTPLTWTVPDKPWSDGDLLMLRIHKPTPR